MMTKIDGAEQEGGGEEEWSAEFFFVRLGKIVSG